jgi:hypothetical protein
LIPDGGEAKIASSAPANTSTAPEVGGLIVGQVQQIAEAVALDVGRAEQVRVENSWRAK